MPSDVAGPTLAQAQGAGAGAVLLWLDWARPLPPSLPWMRHLRPGKRSKSSSLCLSPLLPQPTGIPSRQPCTWAPPAILPLPCSPRSPGIKQKQPWAKYNFI